MEKNAKKLLFVALAVIIAFLSVQIFLNDASDLLDTKQPLEPLLVFQNNDSSEHIQPIPLTLDLHPEKVLFGEKIFEDPTISPNNVSCVSCHNLTIGGGDGLKTSKNSQGGFDEMNTQTVFNCGFNPKFFWNGRASTLQEQLEDVIHNPKHLNSSWDWIVNSFAKNEQYQELSRRIYGTNLNSDIIRDAIITYERSLFTPNSRFDQYLRGNQLAINQEEKQGYELFKSYGCISCHQGINVGGNLVAKFGVHYNPFLKKKVITDTDLGLYAITKNPKDKHVFRVPGLRNVAITGPYFHHGKVKTLEKAIKLMGKAQLGQTLPDKDIKLIAQFLKTLTGQYKGKDL